MMRGLTARTSETQIAEAILYGRNYEQLPVPHQVRVVYDKDTGWSRCFCFIDYDEVEQAQAFMNGYAGSCGLEGPELFIDGQLVTMEYSDKGFASRGGKGKSDWICDHCGATNFARRMACFRCNTNKGPNAKSANTGPGNQSGGLDGDLIHSVSTVPTSILMIKGFPSSTKEEDVSNALRDYAQVKQVRIVRDRYTGSSRGFCFVEFYSVEHATHTLTTWHTLLQTSPLLIEEAKVSLLYAPKAAMVQANMAANMTGSRGGGKGKGKGGKGNYAATAAMEQAQWALQGKRANDDSKEPHWAEALASKTKKPPPEWPPTFEAGGAAWVFDQKSGYYYESASGFWYSTATKLYYNSHKQSYYMHTPTTNPPWTLYSQQPPAPAPAPVPASTSAATTVAAGGNSQIAPPGTSAAHDGKAKTSIWDKYVPPKNGASETPQQQQLPQAQQAQAQAPPQAAPVQPTPVSAQSKVNASAVAAAAERKKAQKELEKWEKKQQKLQQQKQQQAKAAMEAAATKNIGTEHLAAAKLPTNLVSEALTPEATGSALLLQMGLSYTSCKALLLDGKPVIYQNKDKWACLVSRRQFPTEEKLRLHIEKSQLYRDALEKCIKEGKLATNQTTQPVYRDRASERRQRDPLPEKKSKGSAAIQRVEAHYAQVVDSYVPQKAPSTRVGVDRAIDSSNIGNSMLKQMGWKDGTGLGRHGEGITEPVRVNASKHGAGIGMKQYNVNYNDSYLENAKKIAEQRYNEKESNWS